MLVWAHDFHNQKRGRKVPDISYQSSKRCSSCRELAPEQNIWDVHSLYNLIYFQLTNAVTNRYYGTKGKEKEGRNQIVASLCVLLFVHFPLKINK